MVSLLRIKCLKKLRILFSLTVIMVIITVFVNADPDNATFFRDDMGLVNVDLNKVSFDGVNFDNYNPETDDHVGLVAWCNGYTQHKTS